MKSPGIIGIITARGGSKRLLNKCLLPMAGKPSISYSILAALNCPHVTRTVVTTEDASIAVTSREWGAEVIARPLELATDAATSNDVVRHALGELRKHGETAPYFALLQPTSPLRTAEHLTASIETFLASAAACCISVSEMADTPYKSYAIVEGRLSPLFGVEYLSAPAQTLPPVYHQNGAIFLMGCETFLEHDRFFVDPALPYVMPWEAGIDIDTPMDHELAEWLMRRAERAAVSPPEPVNRQ